MGCKLPLELTKTSTQKGKKATNPGEPLREPPKKRPPLFWGGSRKEPKSPRGLSQKKGQKKSPPLKGVNTEKTPKKGVPRARRGQNPWRKKHFGVVHKKHPKSMER